MNEKLFNFLRAEIKDLILKGHILELNDLIEKAYDYNAIEADISYLTTYYNNIIHLHFFKDQKHFEEIIFLGKDGYVVKYGKDRIQYPFPYSNEDFELMILSLCIKNKIDWNFQNPFVSFKTEIHGLDLRATLVHESLGHKNSFRIFLRKLERTPFSSEDFSYDSKILKKLVESKKNIVICGPTGSGKTALLNSLLSYIPKEEHLVTIEDTEEIFYENSFKTSLFSSKSTSMKELLAHSLRMTPDRIILGEMRSKEITTFLLAMNTGHKGLMSTLHSNSAPDAIDRMALLFNLYQEGTTLKYSDVVKLITKSIDVIIFVRDKKIEEVIEIMGVENATPYFRNYNEEFELNLA